MARTPSRSRGWPPAHRREAWIFAPNLGGRRPHRVDPLAVHMRDAGPTGLSDRSADRVGDRPLLGQDLIEPALAESDDDGAGLDAGPGRRRAACRSCAGRVTPEEIEQLPESKQGDRLGHQCQDRLTEAADSA